MKNILLFLLLPAGLFAFQKPANDKVTLVCKIVNMPANADSLTLYELGGLASTVVARIAPRGPLLPARRGVIGRHQPANESREIARLKRLGDMGLIPSRLARRSIRR